MKQPNLRPLCDEVRSLARRVRRGRSAARAARREHRRRRAGERGARRAACGRDRLMVLWFVFGSIFGVWNVFQSPGLDFRLDRGRRAAAARCSTCRSARRPTRTRCSRRWSCCWSRWSRRPGAAGGCGAGARSASRSGGSPRSCSARPGRTKKCSGGPRSARRGPTRRCSGRGPSWSSRSCSGVAAAWWAWTRFGLRDPARRREFWRTGRLTIVGETK